MGDLILKVELPLVVYTTKSKTTKGKFNMNLNVYRNTHYQKLSKAKRIYFDMIKDDVITAMDGLVLPVKGRVKLVYSLYPAVKCDVANILSIVDKFTSDVLVKLGFLVDDEMKYIPKTVYKGVEIDKENPRAILEVFKYGEIFI